MTKINLLNKTNLNESSTIPLKGELKTYSSSSIRSSIEIISPTKTSILNKLFQKIVNPFGYVITHK